MMEKELGPEVIKATQTSLGKYVKRPSLTEKLLKKPPFRFLHDIITTVLKNNGFFEGLFEDDELISDNVKDRDSKIIFLNKVITVVALTTGRSLSIKPSKIVAGQEPDKTNELLQNIAYALDNKLSSDEAVKKFKENLKTTQAPGPKYKDSKKIKNYEETKKLTSKSSEKLVSTKKDTIPVSKNDRNKTHDAKTKKKETVTNKTESVVKKTKSHKNVGKKDSVESAVATTVPIETPRIDINEQNIADSVSDIEEKETIIQDIKNVSPRQTVQDIPEKASNMQYDNDAKNDLNEQAKANPSTININEVSQSSLISVGITNEKEGDKNNENELKSNEPFIDDTNDAPKEVPRAENAKSADTEKKPRPMLMPKHSSLDSEIKTKELARNNSQDNPINKQTPEVKRPASVRPSSSRPGAPRLREKIDIVIPDTDNLLLGKVNIIAESSQNEEEDNSIIVVNQEGAAAEEHKAVEISSNEHGHLVQQILNSQKELSQNSGKIEIEWQLGSQKAKEASSQEIEQLRFNIQALSRVANPLGKLLDHMQEDVEVMRQELQQWTKLYDEVSKDMLQQKAESEKALQPLRTRVKQLDADIDEKRDKINDIKVLIHKNTTRVEKLLANGNVQ